MKEFPPFRLDAADQCLWRGDQRVPLTPKAFAVLQYLVDRAGRLVTQNELLEALWPDTFVQPEVLKSQILDVRTALGDRPREPLFIETIPRRGYRFIAPVRDAAAAAPPAIETASPGKLAGRDPALDELRSHLKRASGGERQIVFVTGEQGLGKTTLVEAFLQEVSGSNIQIARGQCLEGFGVVKEPYYPVLEAIGQLARGAGSESLARILEAQAPTWLIQLPALLKREHRDTLQRELVGATRERMIREICEALESLTTGSTLVLLFEDLHWADHSTVDLIAAVAHRRSPARLFLIGTYRPVDLVLAQHPLKQVSHSLKAHRLSREIALSPLAETDVADYLARQAGFDTTSESLARWVRRQTDGNPLFMVTVIEHLLELGHVRRNEAAWTVNKPLDQIEGSVPDTLRQMVELQIERLSPREQLTLDAASVHGNVFSAVVTASALELEAEDVEDTCQKLARQNHIIRTAAMEQLPDGTFSQRYEFVHAVFRNVFYHRLAPARRAKLHRRFGEKIESISSGDRSEVAAELAGHFEQCADWPRAVEYLWLAARNAWRRFAYREAISILERAVEAARRLPEGRSVREEIRILDSMAVFQNVLQDAVRHSATLGRLAALARDHRIPEVELRVLLQSAAMQATQDTGPCRPLVDRMQSLIAEQTDPLEQAKMRAQAATIQLSLFGWSAGLSEDHSVALAKVRQSGDRLACTSLLIDGCFFQWVESRYADGARNARESLPAMLESGRLVRFQHGRELMATNLTLLGQWGKALDVLDESIHDARKNEAPLRLGMALVFKAWLHLKALDYHGVSEMCATALPLLGPMLDRRYIGMRLAASADLGLGRCDSALERFLEIRDALDQRPVSFGWYWRMPLQLQVTEAWLAKGDPGQARIEANRALELTLQNAERTWQALAWEASARVSLLEGDEQRVDDDLRNALNVMEGFEVPVAAWRVHGTAAKACRRNGDAERERYHLEVSRRTVLALAKSLDSRPALQQVFLTGSTTA